MDMERWGGGVEGRCERVFTKRRIGPKIRNQKKE
jgi:hypothetical protein